MRYLVARTVTMKEAVEALALLSVAEHFTRVLPTLKRVPDIGVHVTGTVLSRSSVAVTRNTTRAE